MDKGVVGVSITNVVIIGIIAIIFVGIYSYVRSKWFPALPMV